MLAEKIHCCSSVLIHSIVKLHTSTRVGNDKLGRKASQIHHVMWLKYVKYGFNIV